MTMTTNSVSSVFPPPSLIQISQDLEHQMSTLEQIDDKTKITMGLSVLRERWGECLQMVAHLEQNLSPMSQGLITKKVTCLLKIAEIDHKIDRQKSLFSRL